MIDLRELRTEDFKAVAEIAVQTPFDAWSDANLLSSLSHQRVKVVGAFDGAQLLGFAVFDYVIGEVELQNICVSMNARRRGVGTRLVAYCLEIFPNVERVFLEVRVSNTGAIALYRNLGFTDCGLRRAYYPTESGREDALLMDWVVG